MNKGWIKLHRGLRDNPIYQNSKAIHIWLECLLSATHEGYYIDFCGEERLLKRGEFIFGRIAWSQRLKIPQTTLGRWIKRLQQRRMVEVVKADRGRATIFRVINWDKYQSETEGWTGRRTGNGRVMDTNNNDKNVKNEIIDSKYSSFKERIPTSSFIPSNNEEAICFDIAKHLNEPFMDFILSKLGTLGLNKIEDAFGKTKEAEQVEDPKRYFNAILTNAGLNSFKDNYGKF